MSRPKPTEGCYVLEEGEVCGTDTVAHGMCAKHLKRTTRNGSTAARQPKELPGKTEPVTFVIQTAKRSQVKSVAKRRAVSEGVVLRAAVDLLLEQEDS